MKEIASASTRVIWQGKSLFSARSDNHIADRLNERNSAIMFIHDEGGMHQVKAWEHHVLKTHRIEHLAQAEDGPCLRMGRKAEEPALLIRDGTAESHSDHGQPTIRSCACLALAGSPGKKAKRSEPSTRHTY